MKTPYEMFQVECGKGWKGLYEPLIELCNLKGNTVLQVKEKFGGLRFYWGGPYDISDLVDAAENLSYQICEDCGKKEYKYDEVTHKNVPVVTTGTSETSGWIRSLCPECRIKWDDSRRK